MELPYSERYWTSDDGLKLHCRDYPAKGEHPDRPPVLCMHGLTRNARDFADLAEHLAKEGWRVIVPEMRGRGLSDYAKDTASYNPLAYVADVERLLVELEIDRFVAIGTSLGGLMTMLMAFAAPERIAGAVLNDIGPEIQPGGVEAIRTYVGQGGSYPTWVHAARALEQLHGASFPDFAIEDWLTMAKRTLVVGQNGRIVFDYDMAIAEPFNTDENAVPPDLWPAFAALAGRPLLLVRGGLSQLLGAATVAEMQRRIPALEVVTIAGVGHAPTLDEPEARAAIGALLARVG